MNNNKSKYIFVIVSVFMQLISIAMSAQTPEKNYIVTETHTDSGSIKSVQYYDALGRPNLLAKGGVNTKGTYVYSKIEYDKLGRESKNWLPVTSSNVTPDFIDSDIYMDLSNSNYGSEQYPYSESKYDVIDRILSKSTPGKEWVNNDKKVKTEYITNDDNEKVIEFSLNAQGIPITTTVNYYPKGSLVGVKITDEDNHTIKTFKDIVGNIVLERRNDGRNNIDTYYVYEKGLLRTVIPPLYLSQTKKDNSLLYLYEYDDYGQCVKKTLPGNVVISYWYDKYGRMAFMQDNRMKSANKYRFYLYDGLSRLVVQGMCTGGAGTIDSTYAAKVFYGTGGKQVDNSNYYVAATYKLDKPTLEIVNYYDGYDCVNSAAFSNVKSTWNLRSKSDVCTTTLQTAQIVTDNLNNRYFRVMYYDEKGRCTEKNSTSIDGYFIKTNTSYSFTDKPTNIITKTYKGSLSSLQHTVIDSIEYNAVCDLPEKEYIKLDNNPMECIADNVYDDLGRLKESKSNNGNIRDLYEYDLHGWLTSHHNYDDRIYYMPMFKEKLYYADGPNTRLCYNGDISAQVYSDADGYYDDKGYLFGYDGMDRMTSAKYMGGSNLSIKPRIDYSEEVTYNENSSVLTMKRMGNENRYGYVDNLTFSYTGNKLFKVPDTAYDVSLGESAGFVDGFDFNINPNDHRYMDYAVEYEYDGCGSLISDKNKGIKRIWYDYNGMPTDILFENGSVTNYIYTADGKKLKTVHLTAVDGTTVSGYTPYLSEQNTLHKDSILYVGAYEFCSNLSDKYFFANGYIDIERGYLDSYCYYAKDHLGNVRHVDKSTPGRDNSIVQITNYYPFGGVIDEGSRRGVDVQNKLYNGKEYDPMHGLNLYDYSARQYDAALGQFTSMDPLCEKYYHISPYAYCAGNPVRYVDTKGKAIETAWDIANVAIDIASLSNNIDKYDYASAAVDALCLVGDGLAAAVPFIPGGFGSAVKASRAVDNVTDATITARNTFQENIRAGKEFEQEMLQKSINEGLEVYDQVLLVPQNGLGNIAGNRTYVDQLIHNSDGTWTIVETKLSNHTPLSKGQRRAMLEVEEGNGMFEVRSAHHDYFDQGQQIHVYDWQRVNKFEYEW